MTLGTGGHFATFTCGIFGIPTKTEVKGNGMVGTIAAPECGKSASSATIDFNGASGVQEHKTVSGTATEYSLMKGSETAAQEAHGTLILGSASTLECT